MLPLQKDLGTWNTCALYCSVTIGILHMMDILEKNKEPHV